MAVSLRLLFKFRRDCWSRVTVTVATGRPRRLERGGGDRTMERPPAA
jgi:hypothetical protein